MDKNHEEECPSCGKKFFCFSLPGEQGHITMSIPAIDESNAISVLDDIVKKPEDWMREKKIEKDIRAKTTGEKKKVAPKEWNPMFG